jgi:hypothetical protein
MYAYKKKDGVDPIQAAAEYAEAMRVDLNAELATRCTGIPAQTTQARAE